MKRSLPITGVAMLLRSFLLYGQAVPPIQVTVGTAARGAPAYFVTNTGTITVTAFALALSLPVPPGGRLASASQVTTYDVALGTAPAPVLAGAQIAVSGVGLNGTASSVPTVQAVVFADGSSWGDGKRVQRIMALRGFTLQRLTRTTGVPLFPRGRACSSTCGTIGRQMGRPIPSRRSYGSR